MESGNVPDVIPKWFIAARISKFKLRTGLITYWPVMLIAKRYSPLPIISPVRFTLTCFPSVGRCCLVYITGRAYSNIKPKTVLSWKREGILVQETKKGI
jgi:hypothetical protein